MSVLREMGCSQTHHGVRQPVLHAAPTLPAHLHEDWAGLLVPVAAIDVELILPRPRVARVEVVQRDLGLYPSVTLGTLSHRVLVGNLAV